MLRDVWFVVVWVVKMLRVNHQRMMGMVRSSSSVVVEMTVLELGHVNWQHPW